MNTAVDEYRSRVRQFIAEQRPDGDWYDGIRVPRDPGTEAAVRRWYAALFDAGYVGGSWPAAYGGHAGHTPQHDAVVMEEIVRARAPRPIDQVMLAAHLLITFGTPEQQDRFLPRIRSAQDIWCQLLSEPGVGSDLARLTTRAARQPDGTLKVVQTILPVDGNVTINSPETMKAIEHAQALYKTFIPGTEGWLDVNNNRAFLAGELSVIANGISAYYTPKNDPAQAESIYRDVLAVDRAKEALRRRDQRSLGEVDHRPHRRDAGIGADDVETAEPLVRLVEHRFEHRRVGDRQHLRRQPEHRRPDRRALRNGRRVVGDLRHHHPPRPLRPVRGLPFRRGSSTT